MVEVVIESVPVPGAVLVQATEKVVLPVPPSGTVTVRGFGPAAVLTVQLLGTLLSPTV